jgi:hypothetical protein
MATKRSLHILFLGYTLLLTSTGCNGSASLRSPTPEMVALTATSEPQPSSTPTQPVPATELTPSATTEGISCPPITADIRAEMDEIEDQVITLRGLRPVTQVKRTLLTPEQLRQRVTDMLRADYSHEEAQDDALELALFGLLDPDFDLWNFYIDLHNEQVAGFYDHTTKEMFIKCGTGFDGLERITYVHEFTHALQDQTYDLEEGLDYVTESCELDKERCAAIQSLIEGDATLLQQQWLEIYASDEDLTELIEFASELETPILDSAPRFMRQDLLFPYLAGRSFIEAHFVDGGWAAVDATYLNPPLSTEQILHHKRYPKDAPVRLVAPDLTDVLGEGWREISRDTLGEWYTQLVLNEFRPKADAVRAAEGWGGDTYLVFHRDDTDEDILIFFSQWDTIRDVHEFSAALADYGDARFGGRIQASAYISTWEGEGFHVLSEHISNQSLWILAPNAEITETLRQAIRLPIQQE